MEYPTSRMIHIARRRQKMENCQNHQNLILKGKRNNFNITIFTTLDTEPGGKPVAALLTRCITSLKAVRILMTPKNTSIVLIFRDSGNRITSHSIWDRKDYHHIRFGDLGIEPCILDAWPGLRKWLNFFKLLTSILLKL